MPPKSIDPRSFWQALGNRAVGAAIVAAKGPAGPAGFLALSATHLCAAPPTLMVSVDGKTSAWPTIRDARHFSVNYVAEGGEGMVADFSGRTEVKGAARFAPQAWTTLVTGAPILRDAVGAFDCRLEEVIERHGTFIAIGTLVDILANPDRKPLVSFRGGWEGICGTKTPPPPP